MLKKLTAALNPFFTKRADHVPPAALAPKAEHPHSFSCACAACEAEAACIAATTHRF
jgi:hypothetical protein